MKGLKLIILTQLHSLIKDFSFRYVSNSIIIITIRLYCLLTMEEKFSLKWNNFQENTIKNFSKLKNEDDFFDVTLVADDQMQMMAHKVILSSCSVYFKNILKTNKHSHPLLCLTGISSMELENVLDYAYHGEVKIFQEDINKFLDIAHT